MLLSFALLIVHTELTALRPPCLRQMEMGHQHARAAWLTSQDAEGEYSFLHVCLCLLPTFTVKEHLFKVAHLSKLITAGL